MRKLMALVLMWLVVGSIITIEAKEENAKWWIHAYGSPKKDAIWDGVVTHEGNIILGGYTYWGSTDSDPWFLMLDSNGNIKWQFMFEVSHQGDEIFSITEAPNGDVILVGRSYHLKGGWLFPDTLFIFAFNSDKTPKWGKIYYAREFAGAFAVTATTDNEIVVAASTADFSDTSDFWIMKFDSNGNLKWQKKYGGNGADQPYSIIIAPNEDIIVAGITSSFSSSQDIWVLRLDKNGNIKWQKRYGGEGGEETQAIAVAPDGDIIVAGWSSSFGNGDSDIWVLRLDSKGNIIWQKAYGGNKQDHALDVVIAPDGDIIVVGDTSSFGDDGDIWILRLNSNGNIKWQKVIGSEDSLEIAHAVEMAPNGNIVVIGVVDGDGIVLNIPPDGNIPDCAYCKDSNAQVKTTNVYPSDTTAIVAEPNVQLQDNKPGYLIFTTAEVKIPWAEHSTQQDMDMSQGLVAYYSFNHCDASDNSGNGYDGKVHGNPKCINGVIGKAFEFDGNYDYIELPTFDAIWEEGFSVCAWAKFERNKSGNYERIIDLGNGDGDTYGNNIWFGRFRTTNNIAVESWKGTDGILSRSTAEGGGRLIAENGISVGEFAFYCAVVDKSGHMAIYKNGALIAEKNGLPVANVVREKNYIAHSNWPWFDPNFKGIIDEVRIYNRALSEEEIKALYSEAFTNHIKLVVDNVPVAFVEVEVWKDGQLIETATSDLEGNVYFTHEIGPEYTLKILGEEYEVSDTISITDNSLMLLTNISYTFILAGSMDEVSDSYVLYTLQSQDGIAYEGNVKFGHKTTIYLPRSKEYLLKVIDDDLIPIDFKIVPELTGVLNPANGKIVRSIELLVPPRKNADKFKFTDFQVFTDTYIFGNFHNTLSPAGMCYGMASTSAMFYYYEHERNSWAKLPFSIKYLREFVPQIIPDNNAEFIPDYGVFPYTNYFLAILLHQKEQSDLKKEIPLEKAIELLDKGELVIVDVRFKYPEITINPPAFNFYTHSLIAFGYVKYGPTYLFATYDPNVPNIIQWVAYNKDSDHAMVVYKVDNKIYPRYNKVVFDKFSSLTYRDTLNARDAFLNTLKTLVGIGDVLFSLSDYLSNYTLLVSPHQLHLTYTNLTDTYYGEFVDGRFYQSTIPYSVGFMEWGKEDGKVEPFYAVIYPTKLNELGKVEIKTLTPPGDLDPYTVMAIREDQITGISINATIDVTTQDAGDGYILRANGTGSVKVSKFTITNTSYETTTLDFQGTNITIQLNETTVQVDLNGDGVIDEIISPPDAEFTFAPNTTGINSPITFNASLSYDSNGSIVRYLWDFGDGTTAEGKVVMHSYSRSGVYTVTLTITDDDDISTSILKTIVIKPIIFFVPPTPEDNAAINQTYVFINITSSEPLETAILEWNGKNITMEKTSHTNWYINMTGLTKGTYTFKIWAKDTNGNLGVSEPRTITLIAPEIYTNETHSSEGPLGNKDSTYKQYLDKISEMLDKYYTKLPLDTRTVIVLIVLVGVVLLIILRRQ